MCAYRINLPLAFCLLRKTAGAESGVGRAEAALSDPCRTWQLRGLTRRNGAAPNCALRETGRSLPTCTLRMDDQNRKNRYLQRHHLASNCAHHNYGGWRAPSNGMSPKGLLRRMMPRLELSEQNSAAGARLSNARRILSSFSCGPVRDLWAASDGGPSWKGSKVVCRRDSSKYIQGLDDWAASV